MVHWKRPRTARVRPNWSTCPAVGNPWRFVEQDQDHLGLNRTDKEKWDTLQHFSDQGVADYKVVGGGEFVADIMPLDFEGEFHETGIQIPEPSRVWNPVQISERAIVQA